MTADLSAPALPWGVRYAAAMDRASHVDPYVSEAGARRFLHALGFMGNTDAVLVRWDGTAWVPAEASHG